MGRMQIEMWIKHGRMISVHGPARWCCVGEAVWAK